MAEAFIVEQSHQSHQDGTIGTEGHSLLAPEDDWGFSGSIMVGWKVFLAQESKTSERARCVWDTGIHLCVEGCGMRPQTRGGPGQPLAGEGGVCAD